MTPRQTDLSTERIVTEAIALLDADGVDALSMRKLAARLGVSPMSLYHHVADKHALIEGIAEAIMRDLVIPGPDVAWDEAIRDLATSFRAITLEHPAAFQLLISGETPAALLRTAASAIDLLQHGGFDEHAAVATFRTFVRFLLGSTVVEQDLSEHREPEARTQADAQFVFSIDLLIAGASQVRGQPSAVG